MINNNTTNYNSYNVTNDDVCSICLEPMKNTESVAHEGLGHLHALHRSCAKAAIVYSNICPSCKVPINRNSLLTAQEGAAIAQEANEIGVRRAVVLAQTLAVVGTIATTVVLTERVVALITEGAGGGAALPAAWLANVILSIASTISEGDRGPLPQLVAALVAIPVATVAGSVAARIIGTSITGSAVMAGAVAGVVAGVVVRGATFQIRELLR